MDRRVGAGHAAAVRVVERAAAPWPALRLRPRAVRVVFGAHRRRRETFVRHAGVGGRRKGDYDARRSADLVRAVQRLSAAPELHPVQQAMLDEQAPQCGYCYNGMMVKAAELLSKNPRPDETQIRSAMNGHLCRCGTYPSIIRAVRRASELMASQSEARR